MSSSDQGRAPHSGGYPKQSTSGTLAVRGVATGQSPPFDGRYAKTALTIHTGSEGSFLRIYHQKVLALLLQMFHSRVKVSFRVKEETFTQECNTCKQATLAGVAAKTSGMNHKDAPRPPHTMLAGDSGFTGRL